MPKYTVTNNAFLVQDGKVFKAGETIELTAEQAERLGNKVEATSETELSGKTVKELKEEAKMANIEGYSQMNKEELIAALAKDGEQEDEAAPTEDGEQD
ncbi:hypothetical protein [Bacillus phage PM1]|uniref:Rho termination factor-like N-terminal domain-containing protein n=1 Tax=Bacillus phage PM1 TaxID=547228 RepID=M4ZS13_9CAUD|nr:hypothetical protein K203_gp63 [Bacillus phage PM1]BAM99143.1 hypothetical protein [Bacillus phage PM1]